MSDFVNACTDTLAKYLQDTIRPVRQVVSQWPSANVKLKMPSITITSAGGVDFAAWGAPFLQKPVVLDDDGVAVVTEGSKQKLQFVVGTYDLSLQLDFWTRNKEERGEIYQLFFDAFNPDLEVPGLRLPMTEYYGAVCNYTQTDYSIDDSESASQRQEWRQTVTILATANAILERNTNVSTLEPVVDLTVT